MTTTETRGSKRTNEQDQESRAQKRTRTSSAPRSSAVVKSTPRPKAAASSRPGLARKAAAGVLEAVAKLKVIQAFA
jgi:hypothetical protein